MARSNKLSAKEAIAKVLGDAGKPMQVPDIIKAAVPLTNLGGKTPGQTIYSVLYAEKKKGSDSIFKRTSKGTFKLDAKAVERAEKAATAKEEARAAKKAASASKTSASKSKTAGSKSKSASAKSSAAKPDPKPSSSRKRSTAGSKTRSGRRTDQPKAEPKTDLETVVEQEQAEYEAEVAVA